MFKCCPQQADPTNNAWKLMLQYSPISPSSDSQIGRTALVSNMVNLNPQVIELWNMSKALAIRS